jgi:hypothetical protein
MSENDNGEHDTTYSHQQNISPAQELQVLLRENKLEAFFEISGIEREMPEADELQTMIYLAHTAGKLIF